MSYNDLMHTPRLNRGHFKAYWLNELSYYSNLESHGMLPMPERVEFCKAQIAAFTD